MTRAPTRRFPFRWWHRPTAPRGHGGQLLYAEMSASTRQNPLGVSTTLGGACRGASPSPIEPREQGREQSPLPAGTRICGACTGVAIVNRRSASGRGSLIRPGTRHLDTRGVSTLPPIGHRLGRTQPKLALRGAARNARHQGEEDQLGSPRGAFVGGSAHVLVWLLPCVSRATQHGASENCAISVWRRTVDRLVLHRLRLHRPFRGKGNGKAPCAAKSQRPGLLFLQFGINWSIQCSERCAIAAKQAHFCNFDVDSGSAGRRSPPVLMRCTKPSNHARIEGSGAPEGSERKLV